MLNQPGEPFWSLILLVTGGAYLIVLEMVRRGLGRLERSDSNGGGQSDRPFVSVIIPCRDEAQHIAQTLADLAGQDYPADRFEVIVVDDRSADSSGDIARSFADRIKALAVLRIESCPEGFSPKKNALRRGIRQARGDILITTDGDCRFQPNWISSLVAEFAPHVGMVCGLTIFDRGRREPFWQRMQQLDYLSQSFLAAGAIGRGWAFNCNGSNLALRREAFADVVGYNQFHHVITGDDTLLLQRLRRSGRWQIRFSAQLGNVVRSWPEETLRGVLSQRLRWGSGGLSYTRPALTFAITTFIFFLSLLTSPVLWLLGWIGPLWMLFPLLKAVQEFRVMARGFKLFRLKNDWPAFWAMELLHVPAILTFSIGGHLVGFRWKGERFRRARRGEACLAPTTIEVAKP